MNGKPRYRGFHGGKMPCLPDELVEVVWRMAGGGVVRTKTVAGEFSWGYMEKENIVCYRVLPA